MLFTLIDVILLIGLAIFAVVGWMMGLLEGLGALLGLALGFFLANSYAETVAGWLPGWLGGQAGLAKTVAFIVLFILVNRALALAFWLVGRFFGFIYLIPFLKPINKLSGLFLGLVEGILVLGLAVYAIFKFMGGSGWLAESLNDSGVAHFMVLFTRILTDLIN